MSRILEGLQSTFCSHLYPVTHGPNPLRLDLEGFCRCLLQEVRALTFLPSRRGLFEIGHEDFRRIAEVMALEENVT